MLLSVATTAAAPASAQSSMSGVDEIADALVQMTAKRWVGPRVDPPAVRPRPNSVRSLASAWAPVRVHATSKSDDLEDALSALETAYRELDIDGWRWPASDGGLGGGFDMDLYLVNGAQDGGFGASDGLLLWTYFDRASTFAVVDSSLPLKMRAACVAFAYADALLMAIEPAESAVWRHATAAYLTWAITGEFGCSPGVEEAQNQPEKGWLSNASNMRGAGGLFWALLARHHDSERTRFVRELWDFDVQRTWDGDALRASPDMWMVLEQATDRAGVPWRDTIQQVAIDRMFVANKEGFASTPRWLADFSQGTSPMHTKSDVLSLTGTAYIRTRVSGDASVLRAWIRAEYGVVWSVDALVFSNNSNRFRRMSAVTTESKPDVYFPIEIDANTSSVVFVITNLGVGRPDTDVNEDYPRAFSLVTQYH
ncbi:MAG: hypothetical protein R3A47_02270 [Polyangiales bacterium]